MSKAKKAIEFAHASETSEEGLTNGEKMEAAQSFKELVDGVFLKFANLAKVHDHNLLADRSEASLLLAAQQEDNSYVSIGIRSTLKDDGSASKEITVQEIDQDGYGHNAHRYHMESEDEVLRFDTGDVIENIRTDRAMGIAHDPTTEISVDFINKMMASLQNTKENQQLARQMGLNDQPVSPDEIIKLTQLVDAAEARNI